MLSTYLSTMTGVLLLCIIEHDLILFFNMVIRSLMNINLSETFIKELTSAHSMYSVLYIHGLSCAVDNRSEISIAKTAKLFNILESDVINAWQFWQAKNFVQLTFEGGAGQIFVEFLREDFCGFGPSESAKDAIQEIAATQTKKILFYNKPTYSPQELELYKASHSHIEHIFILAEKAMGRLLKSSELSTIYSFYDWLRLSTDVIEILLNHCAQNNQRNINYIEKVAVDWAETGINTAEKAQEHIIGFNKNYRKVLKALGQAGRDITPKEQSFVDKWLNLQHQSLELVLEACDKTMMNLGKPNFAYTDKILKAWHDSDITTIEQVISSEAQFKTTPKTQKKTGKFSNYTQNSIDYDQLESAGLKLLKNSLGRGEAHSEYL